MHLADKRNVLTPDALALVDAIARTGSFAGAARELGKVPSALTYSVRQLEDALDVLLFDRSARHAQLTAAGQELLHEGRRLLMELDAVANRVQRIATGWEAELTIAVDDAIARPVLYDLIAAFQAQRVESPSPVRPAQLGGPARTNSPPTRLRFRTEVMSGTWEALLAGHADLSIGTSANPPGPHILCEPIGILPWHFVVAPDHPLANAENKLSALEIARHRIITVGDTARQLAPRTIGVLPGQDVLTLPSLQAKFDAQLKGLGCGWLPEPLVRDAVQRGLLVVKDTFDERVSHFHYAWRNGPQPAGKALAWWLDQLRSEVTRKALLGT
ncbi:LysR family transcriptional regulator [Inhella gelatinilytica]|uniref:LysR family transcriptional regulator n=1 Tax=Inhella gelatinilytica TaxID=2795030 RepID=A0A931IYV0_9BURK|nr:LysR family transcriptional regulator [Inhella gelatinilytica]MBH9553515.1 LysR family transcriptional regulator [Inhella gelatinilytica]